MHKGTQRADVKSWSGDLDDPKTKAKLVLKIKAAGLTNFTPVQYNYFDTMVPYEDGESNVLCIIVKHNNEIYKTMTKTWNDCYDLRSQFYD